MTTKTAVHPGEILRTQFMSRHGLSASALAIRLHVPAPRVNDIVRERRAVTADTALRPAEIPANFARDIARAVQLQDSPILFLDQVIALPL